MHRYLVNFVCTREGVRITASQGVDVLNPISPAVTSRRRFADRFRQLVERRTGAEITNLTITDIRPA